MMPRAILAMVLIALMTLARSGEAQPEDLLFELLPTGFSTRESEMITGDRLVVIGLDEISDLTDYNGDGDLGDRVYHVFDAARSEVVNLGLACDRQFENPGDLPVVVDGRKVLLLVHEPSQGQDLNGNGRLDEAVYFLFDAESHRLVQLGGFALTRGPWEGTRQFALARGWALCTVDELGTGFDFDEDGRLEESPYLAASHLASDRLLRLPALGDIRIRGHRAMMVASEASLPPPQDLNDDGDLLDYVPMFLDLDTGEVRFIPSAGAVSTFSEELAATFLNEHENGDRDLNGDGDTDDTFSAVFDFSTHTILPELIPSTPYTWFDGRQMVWQPLAPEPGYDPLRVYDADSGETRLLTAVSGQVLDVAPGRVVLHIIESRLGRDVTGDGDQEDVTLVLLDTENDRFESLWPGQSLLARFDDRLVLQAFESVLGEDLNEDGDQDDRIVLQYELTTGKLENTRLAIAGHIAGPESVVVSVVEDETGWDVDGDGQVGKDRFPVLILADGSDIHVLPRAPSPFTNPCSAGVTIPLTYSEWGRDLNGNGTGHDTLHDVAQRVDLSIRTVGSPHPSGKLAFELSGTSVNEGHTATVLISLGNGIAHGAITLPGGEKLYLDADPLLASWITLPPSTREARLSGRSVSTSEIRLPDGLPAGVRVHFAGFTVDQGRFTSTSITRSFVTGQ